MKKFRQWSLAALILCMGSTAFAQEPTAKDLIAYRQGVMEALGKHIGAISMMVRGKVPYDHMVVQANALAATAATVGDVFPAGSDMGDTHALPAVWEQEADFQAKVTALQDAATNFAAVAAGGDKAAIGKALGAVGGSCKGCHDNYKQAD
jgi:cytochrome c556